MQEVPVDNAASILWDVLTPVIDQNSVKNIPPKKHLSSLRFLIINETEWFRNYREGYSSNNGWYVYDFPSSSQPIKGNLFPVFTTLDTITNIKYFIIDANGNFDFADDVLLSQNIDSISQYSSFSDTLYARFQFKNENIIEKKIPIKIYPEQTKFFKNDPLSNKLGISVAYNRGLKGVFDAGNIYTYTFLSNIPNFGIFKETTRKDEISVITQNKKEELIDGYSYFVKDTMNINNRLYVIDNLDRTKNELVLRFIKKTHYGYSVGSYLPDYFAVNFFTKRKISVSKIRKKYLLLDFWGTWCAPCIEGIPHLREIREKNVQKIDLISLAYDQPKDTSKLRQMISKKNMNWEHVWIDRSVSKNNNLVKYLKVETFPTFIIVNKKGKIIYRGSEMDALEKMIE